jgi:DNA polymerase III subunit delta'
MGYNFSMSWGLTGHEWAEQLLRQHIAAGKVRHAYLFTGPSGIGKRTLALRFAQALCCTAPPASGETCGSCRACKAIPQQAHTDLHCIAREEDRSQIRVEQMRELQRQLVLAPLESRYRIALLAGFEQANEEAQNALLKTLEEPSSQVVLLLTAEASDLLLPTIVSRCEGLSLKPVPMVAIRESLSGRGVAEGRAHLLASLAGGRPGLAFALLEHEDRLQERQAFLGDLGMLLAEDTSTRFGFLADRFSSKRDESLSARRRRAGEMLACWQGLWRDALLAAHEAEVPPVNVDCSEMVDSIRQACHPEAIAQAVLAIGQTAEAIERNVDPLLAMENLMLDLPRIRTAKPA